MVYNGPSKGCRTCRTRRIKCDQTRAACLNCSRRNTVCPGYGDVFERMHRDETSRVTKRNAGNASTLEVVDGLAVQATNAQASPATKNASRRIVTAISPDLESVALGFFFHRYGRADTDPDIEATCSFFEFLPAMYGSASVSSPVSRAIAALAIRIANQYGPRRSSNAISACRYYLDAVAGTKQALADPTRSKSDELLMTTLVLEAYEGVAASFERRQPPHAHALGSIALLEHRGALNGRSELSRRMVIAVGGRFLREAVGGMANISAVRRLWEDVGAMTSQNPAVLADTLALEFAQLECPQHSIGNPHAGGARGLAEAVSCRSILSRASDLAIRCMRWWTTLPRGWTSSPVPCDALPLSIQAAGVYSSPLSSSPHCDVYRNLSVANTLNRHRITELRSLALLRISLAAAISADRSHQYEPSPFDLERRAQVLLDEICASVPFFAGDVTAFTDLHAKDLIQLPHTALPRAPQGSPEDMMGFPEDEVGYTQRVVSSGMWMIHQTLAATLELLVENQPLRTVPREGQHRWIRSQLSRLRAVFMLGC